GRAERLKCGHSVCRRNTNGQGRRTSGGPIPIPLRRPKEEELILPDWPAKRKTELVLYVYGVRSKTTERGFGWDGSHRRIPVDLPSRAMEFVVTSLVNDVRHRAATTPEFRAVGVGENGHLADGL